MQDFKVNLNYELDGSDLELRDYQEKIVAAFQMASEVTLTTGRQLVKSFLIKQILLDSIFNGFEKKTNPVFLVTALNAETLTDIFWNPLKSELDKLPKGVVECHGGIKSSRTMVIHRIWNKGDKVTIKFLGETASKRGLTVDLYAGDEQAYCNKKLYSSEVSPMLTNAKKILKEYFVLLASTPNDKEGKNFLL